MYQAFEADVMDDLFYDAAEGPAQTRRSAHAYDAYDDYDDSFDAYDQYDAYDEGDPYDAYDGGNAFEDAMVDALEAEDSDEFLGQLLRGATGVARRVAPAIGRAFQTAGRLAQSARPIARQYAPTVGRLVRQYGPIAESSSNPNIRAAGQIAGLLGDILPNAADEFEALDALVDLAEAEGVAVEAAPAVASLAIHGVMPQVARLPYNTRRQLLQSTSQAAELLIRRNGPQAARAIPQIVATVQRNAQQRRLPVRALPQAIRRTTARVANSPGLIRRLSQTASM